MLCYVMLWYVMLYCVMLYYVMLCYVMLVMQSSEVHCDGCVFCEYISLRCNVLFYDLRYFIFYITHFCVASYCHVLLSIIILKMLSS